MDGPWLRDVLVWRGALRVRRTQRHTKKRRSQKTARNFQHLEWERLRLLEAPMCCVALDGLFVLGIGILVPGRPLLPAPLPPSIPPPLPARSPPLVRIMASSSCLVLRATDSSSLGVVLSSCVATWHAQRYDISCVQLKLYALISVEWSKGHLLALMSSI